MRISSQRSEEDLAAQAALEVSRNAERRQVEGLKMTDWTKRQLRLRWWKRLRRKAVHILLICHNTIIQAFLKMLSGQ